MPIEMGDLIRVSEGDLVRMEMYQLGLKEAGIESQVVGDELEAGLGTALPESIQLWVSQRDFDRATAVIERMEAERGRPPRSHSPHEHPKSDPKPHNDASRGTHTHYDPDPRS